MVKSISTDEVKRLIPNVKIIDIRDNYQFNMGSIPTSINIPSNFLMTNPSIYLKKENTYYIYCEYGSTSTKVCSMLTKQGYNVINIVGGFNDYKLK